MAKSGDHSDLYMKFVQVDGVTHVKGESRTKLASSDAISKSLLVGFTETNIFEIDSFSMGAQVNDHTKAELTQELMKQNRQTIADYHKRAREGQLQQGEKEPREKSKDQIDHDADTQIKRDAGASPVKEIRFSREIDTSSSALLGNIIAGKGYKSASLVKRKAGGHKADGGGAIAGDVYLRIDFDTVLVTSIDWADEDGEVKENCTFICKKITIKYRPQLPSGKLGAIKSGEFEFKPPDP